MKVYEALCAVSMIGLSAVNVYAANDRKTNSQSAPSTQYHYSRYGGKDDISTRTLPGVALVGGGVGGLGDALLWLCNKSGDGDFLVLNAEDNGDILPNLVASECNEHSVATLTIPNREAATDPFVADTIRKAEAIFIDGGLQGDYIKYWEGTPVQKAINDQVSHGVPIGGTSAGMAVLGEFAYTGSFAQSDQTLSDPYNNRVMITHGFLDIPELANTITDQHLVARKRLGRLLGFIARIRQDERRDSIQGIGVDENSAVLLEPSGSALVVGKGMGAYFIRPSDAPALCKRGTPLTFRHIEIQRLSPGSDFNLSSWSGPGAAKYEVNIESGAVQSSLPEAY